MIETLECRVTPAIKFSPSPGSIVNLVSDGEGNIDEKITVYVDSSGDLIITQDTAGSVIGGGTLNAGAASAVTVLNIDMGGTTDGGSNRVTLGNFAVGAKQSDLLAIINIKGSGGLGEITRVDNLAETVDTNVTIGGAAPQILGLGGPITTNMNGILVDLGSGSDTINVSNLANGFTQVSGNNGNDVFNVGADTFGTVLNVFGDSGIDVFNANFTVQNQFIRLDQTTLVCSATSALTEYFGMEAAIITAPAGDEQIQITGTGCLTTVLGGDGNDTIFLGSNAFSLSGNLDRIDYQVFVDAQGGSDNRLLVADETDTTSLSPIVFTRNPSSSRYVIQGMAGLFDNVDIEYAASGGSFSSNPGTPSFVRTSNTAGDDITVQSVASNISIESRGGNDALTLDFSAGLFGTGTLFSFDGGNGASDSLKILSGASTADLIAYTFVGASAGSLAIQSAAVNFGVKFNAVEFIDDPASAKNRQFNFSGTNDTLTMGDTNGAGNNKSTLNTGSTIVDFLSPTVSMSVDAGGGDDSLTVNPLDSLFPNGVTPVLSGGSGTDTLIGANVVANWLISAANAGTLSYTSPSQSFGFSLFEKLTGGTGSDKFQLASTGSITGLIDGGGGAGTDTLAAPDVDTLFTVLGGGAFQMTNVASAVGIEVALGGAKKDTFKINNAAVFNGTLDGGGGKDTIDFSAWNSSITVNLQTQTASNIATVTNIENATGGSAGDSLTGSSGDNVLRGGPGNDTMEGGAGNDTYVFDDNWGFDAITDSAGSQDVFSFAGITTQVVCDLNLGVVIAGAASVNIAPFIEGIAGGSLGTDKLFGPNAGAAWNLVGPNQGSVAGKVFSSFENLIGGTGTDQFNLTGANWVSSGTIDGGGGVDSFKMTATSGAEAFALTATTFTINNAVAVKLINIEGLGIDGGGGDDSFTANFALFKPFSTVEFKGGDGYDSANIRGGAAFDNATMTVNGASITGVGFVCNVLSTEGIQLTGSPNDVVTFTDTAGSDRFDLYPLLGMVRNGTSESRATGFGQIFLNRVYGGSDAVYIYDSAGNDTYTAKGTKNVMQGSGYRIEVNGFKSVTAYSTAGGNDVAKLQGTAGADKLTAKANYAIMSGSGYSNSVYGFKKVVASSGGGADKIAKGAITYVLTVQGTFKKS